MASSFTFWLLGTGGVSFEARGASVKTSPSRSPVQDVILLEGIQVPAALGVTAAERRVRRPVLLDLEVARDLRAAGRSDRIRHTLHYKRIFEVVEDVAANQEHRLVEALGGSHRARGAREVRRRLGDGDRAQADTDRGRAALRRRPRHAHPRGSRLTPPRTAAAALPEGGSPPLD